MKEAGQRYTGIAQSLHWLMAAIIITAWSIGFYAAELPKSPEKLTMIGWHKAVASTVLVLIVLRIVWRLTHPAPPLPGDMPLWQKRLANIAHFLIYALMIALPMSGWAWSSSAGYSVKVAGLLELPPLMGKSEYWHDRLGEVHEVLAFTLATLVVIHVAAALKHYFFDHDTVLLRMMPKQRH